MATLYIINSSESGELYGTFITSGLAITHAESLADAYITAKGTGERVTDTDLGIVAVIDSKNIDQVQPCGITIEQTYKTVVKCWEIKSIIDVGV